MKHSIGQSETGKIKSHGDESILTDQELIPLLYELYLLFMLTPMYFLLHSAIEIYRRNPVTAENRSASFTMLLLFLLFLTDYAQLIIPIENVAALMAYVKYPITLFTGGCSLVLHIVFTSKYQRISLRAGITVTVIVLTVYFVQLGLYGPFYFIDEVEPNGHWPLERPSAALGAYLLIVLGFFVINCLLSFSAWRKSNARFDKKRYAILIRTNMIYLTTVILCTAAAVTLSPYLSLPSTITIFPVLAWGAAIRFMMVNNDFLPSPTRKYEVLFQISPAPILILDRFARIKEANPRAKEMFGLECGGDPAVDFESFFTPEDRAVFRDMYLNDFPNIGWHGKEMALFGGNGQLMTVLMDMETMAENGEPYGLAILSDITQRKEVEQYTDYLAHYDILTGLPNRLAFKQALNCALASHDESQAFAAVLLVDLDRFKMINDSLGHQYGDDVLKVISARFREGLPPEAVMARAGGDEFMILVRGASEYEEIIRNVEKLHLILESPVILLGREFFITASIGISLIPSDGVLADTIIKNADIAMYHAKSSGGNQYRFFSKDLNASFKHMVEMEANLRKALENKEFIVLYQPQININNGNTIGAEALIRWNSKEYGMVPPSDFIPLAEQTGLIWKIGQWVLEEACKEAKGWEAAGWKSLVVSVNVSAKQFKQPDFVDMVKNVLRESGLSAEKLCLEITESVVIDKLEVTLKMLDELVAMGVQISIDDFGTGYSSLSILRQLPISAIKIDRSFICEMLEVKSVHTVVYAMISMTHNLGKTVVAEGIESEEQLRWLKEMGCNKGQGYFIDKPLTAEKMKARLREIPVKSEPRSG